MDIYFMTKLTGFSQNWQPSKDYKLEKNHTNNLFLQIVVVPQRKRTGWCERVYNADLFWGPIHVGGGEWHFWGCGTWTEIWRINGCLPRKKWRQVPQEIGQNQVRSSVEFTDLYLIFKLMDRNTFCVKMYDTGIITMLFQNLIKN